jgi:hypothetical protein
MVYTNADWVGCSDACRSASGYTMFLGANLVSWSLKHQNVVSHSSAEAEYQALANGVVEAFWMWQLLQELHAPLTKSILIYCDNVSTVYFSTNHIQHQCTKHVKIDLHFVRQHVAACPARVDDIPIHGHLHQGSAYFRVFGVSVQSQTFTLARVSIVEVLETCYIIGTWVKEHLLHEV